MSIPLPDVALTELSATRAPLDWVGMDGIDVPILLDEPEFAYPVHARAEVQVDLPDPAIKAFTCPACTGFWTASPGATG